MNSLHAPVFAPRGDTDGSMIDLQDVFSDCFTQDWQFLTDALGSLPAQSEAANSISAIPEPIYNHEEKNKVVQRPIGRGKEVEKIREGMTHQSKRQEASPRRSVKRYSDEDYYDEYSAGYAPQSKRGRVRIQQNEAFGKRRRGQSSQHQDNKSLTERQRIERRERNREHAKRSRIRKKFMLESLLEQLEELRGENKQLRQIIRDEVSGDEAHAILNSCSTEESLLLCAEATTQSTNNTTQQLMEPDFRLMQSLQTAQQNFVVSDPSLPDNPIVYASRGFMELTGYTSQQCLGRNCRFLQGPGTDPAAVDIIRKGVEQGIDTSVCLLNYKADGTPFWNQFFVAALRDADGHIVNYVGVQCQANEVPIDEIKERAKHMALLDL